MKKLHLNTVLALMVMTAGFAFAGTTAHAETLKINAASVSDNVSDQALTLEKATEKNTTEAPGKPSWTVTYNGSAMDSNYVSSKATESGAMPGDTIVYSVNLKNGSGSDATFYMSTDVVKTLEEGSEATGGAYSYKITYSGSDEPIFDSETVGGDKSVADVIGLNQVNGNEGSYFSLGSIAKGDYETIKVTVVLDGNSQTNKYMATLAELEIMFGAEPTDSAHKGDSIERHNTVVKSVVNTLDGGTEVVIIDDEDIPLNGGNPLTGDSALPLIICAVAFLVGLMMIFWYFILTRKQKEEVA